MFRVVKMSRISWRGLTKMVMARSLKMSTYNMFVTYINVNISIPIGSADKIGILILTLIYVTNIL